MGTLNRYAGSSALLIGSAGPVSTMIAGNYGVAASRRFGAGMSATLAAQQLLVGLAVGVLGGRAREHRGHQLNLVDMLTLSRGWAASLLVGLVASRIRDRRGLAGWMGWLAVLYGAILCDWLDGPIARHRGTSQVGALLDLEADSWLTLCTAAGAVAWGDLPVYVAAAPVLRYLLVFEAVRTRTYGDIHADEPGWMRHIGILQMLLFIAALAPFGGRATRLLVRLITPLQSSVQICGLFMLHQRLRRG